MATLEDLKKIFSERAPHEVAIEISGFTGFRTTLMEELTPAEIDKLYNIHQGKYQRQISDLEALKRHWRSNVLTIATEEGIKEPNGWEKFNHWMLNRSKFKKHLNAHNLEELKALHRQLCQLRDNNEKSAKKPFNKAWLRKGIKNQNLN